MCTVNLVKTNLRHLLQINLKIFNIPLTTKLAYSLSSLATGDILFEFQF